MHAALLALRSLFKNRVALRLVCLLLLFIAMRLGVEYLFFDKFLGVPEQDVSIVARFYRLVTTTSGRGLRPQHCTIVRVDSPASPLLQLDDCAMRGKLADVLRAVISYEPRAVVADYSLRRLECCRETSGLVEAAQKACAATNRSPVPVVFGYDLGPGPKILAHTSITPAGTLSACAMGVTNPRMDVRIIPLQFKVDGYPVPSLAWSVVQMAGDDSLKKDLASYVIAESPLYAALLNSNDFRENTITDAELLSGKCNPKLLRGRVVVIGSGDDPVIPTVFGPLPSHVLQAGYIEALFGRRTLREVPWPVGFIVALVFWYPIETSRRFPTNITVLACATGALLLLSISFVAIIGWYGDFATISLIGFVLWLFTAIKEAPTVQRWTQKHLHITQASD